MTAALIARAEQRDYQKLLSNDQNLWMALGGVT